jgi:hypothetical protein
MRDKDKKAAYNKDYYEKHRKEMAAYSVIWRAANIDNQKEYAKNYRAKHPDQMRATKTKWEAAHVDERRAYWKKYNIDHSEEKKHKMRIRRYNLPKDEYDALMKKQGGTCAICKAPEWNGRGPHVDHSHVTGKVRGILCHNCNNALGMIKDDPKIAKAIISYLKSGS